MCVVCIRMEGEETHTQYIMYIITLYTTILIYFVHITYFFLELSYSIGYVFTGSADWIISSIRVGTLLCSFLHLQKLE